MRQETFYTHRPAAKFVTMPTEGISVLDGGRVAFAGRPPQGAGSTSGGMSGGMSGAISTYDPAELALAARCTRH